MTFIKAWLVYFLIQREVMRSCLVTDNWKERISEIPRAKRMANEPWAVNGERVRLWVLGQRLVSRASQLQIPIPCVYPHMGFCSKRARKGGPRSHAKRKPSKSVLKITWWHIFGQLGFLTIELGLLSLREQSMPLDPSLHLVEQRLELRVSGLVLIPPRGCDYTFTGTRHMQKLINSWKWAIKNQSQAYR